MLIALLLAVLILGGIHPGIVAVTYAAMRFPVLFLAAVVGWGAVNAARRRTERPGPGDETALFTGLASELRGGASLRSSLQSATARAPRLDLDRVSRLAAAGAPAERVAAAIEAALPVNGRAASAAYVLTSTTGGRAAAVFSSLAIHASNESELRRERRALTAQARMSASIVGVAPLAFALLLVATGRGGGFTDTGAAGVVLAGVGVSLELLGLGVIWLMVRRAER